MQVERRTTGMSETNHIDAARESVAALRERMYEENRRAKLRLDRAQLTHLLDLPENYYVEYVYTSKDPVSFVVVVSSPDLDPQPINAELPFMAQGAWHRKQVIHDNELYVRWEWLP